MMPSIAILAGGLATRLYPLTQTTPKSLIEVADKPFIAHQLALLERQGIRDVVICAGHLGEQIESFVGTGKQFGLSVQYSLDGHKLLGTGGAIQKALPLLTDNFFVMYGDSYLDIDFNSLYQHSLSSDRKNIMTIIKNKDNWDKSNIVFKEGTIICYDKIKKTPAMEYIDYGLSLLRKSAFADVPSQAHFDLAQLYQDLILKHQMLGHEVTQRFYEIGSATGLAETEKYLLNLRK